MLILSQTEYWFNRKANIKEFVLPTSFSSLCSEVLVVRFFWSNKLITFKLFFYTSKENMFEYKIKYILT